MHKFIVFLLISVLIYSCGTNERKVDQSSPSNLLNLELFKPVGLNVESTEVHLKDYVIDIELIDSIKYKNESIAILDDFRIKLDNPENLMDVVEVYIGDQVLALPVKASTKQKVNYSFDIKGLDIDQLQIKGEMNAWNPNANEFDKEGTVYSTEFFLEPGHYQYLLIADGKDMLDTQNERKASNNHGGLNSLLEVKGKEVQKLGIDVVSYDKENVVISKLPNTEYLILWENMKISPELEDEGVKVIIPSLAKAQKRSHLRAYAFNEDGISNELLIPLENGKIITEANSLKRSDFYNAIVYNVFLDRFYNGNTDNDWKNPEEDIHPKANYHGGDVAGATAKLKDGYFDSLSVNTIWISPVVKNSRGAWGKYPEPETRFSAYHGYWPVSFTQVDDRLTNSHELKEMVQTAHSLNKNVLLDFVANHVHQEHPFYQEHPEVATSLYLPDGTMNTEKWDEHRLTTWFDTFMPSLDLTRPEVYTMLSDSAVYWIQEYGFDGFRHDATKHVPMVFWRELTRKLKTAGFKTAQSPLYQLGETYGTTELIGSYLSNGLLDAQFDFNLYDAMVAGLLGVQPMSKIGEEIEKSMKYYGDHHLMGNITGNQDRARFISYASGDLRLDQDSKWEGWNRHVGIKDSTAYKSSLMLNALVATVPGIPVIFYGDEIGMSGGNDPDNRKMMRFDDWNKYETELYNQTCRLLHFRSNSMPMIYGSFEVVEASDDVLVYERKYLDQINTVIINKGDKPHRIRLNEEINASLFESSIENGMANIPGRSCEIFYNKR